MGLYEHLFQDITIKNENVTANIHLSRFGGRFAKAQVWIDRELVRKMEPVIPRNTGAFLNKIKSENASRAGTGKVVTVVPPQGKRLYEGVNDEGKPFNWTNPSTQPYWGSYAIQNFKPEFMDGVKKILLEGEKK